MTSGREFSGFGFVDIRREAREFYIYDFALLDVGSEVFTEIAAEKTNLKLNPVQNQDEQQEDDNCQNEDQKFVDEENIQDQQEEDDNDDFLKTWSLLM